VKSGTGRREITLPEYLIGDARVHDPLFVSAFDLIDPTFPDARQHLEQQLDRFGDHLADLDTPFDDLLRADSLPMAGSFCC